MSLTVSEIFSGECDAMTDMAMAGHLTHMSRNPWRWSILLDPIQLNPQTCSPNPVQSTITVCVPRKCNLTHRTPCGKTRSLAIQKSFHYLELMLTVTLMMCITTICS